MTLQEFIDFDLYVRCFTFGKTDITPVAYDPRERRYLVEHAYLSPELGARVVRDAQTINLALGYEMNTIEFAVQDGVPYAIDYLNPAPDFERDRITDFYFAHVVEKMARPRRRSRAERRPVAVLAAVGGDAGHRPGVAASPARRAPAELMDGDRRAWHALLRPDVELTPAFVRRVRRRRCGRGSSRSATASTVRSCGRSSSTDGRGADARRRRDDCRARRARRAGGARIAASCSTSSGSPSGDAARADRSGLRDGQHGLAARRVPAARFAALRRVQRRVAGRPRVYAAALRALRRAAGHGAVP